MSYRKIRPPARARIIEPPTVDWPNQGIVSLGNLPSAAGTVIDKGILPQLLRRQGLGTMGSVHMVEHYAQNFPRLEGLRENVSRNVSARLGTSLSDRMKNIRSQIDLVKSKVRGQTVIPTPWGPRNWPRTEDVGGLPSVASVMSGPAMSMFPMLGRLSTSPEDGRAISIHTDMDNLVSEPNLATGISVQVE